ncbi:MAG TPA: hypothetical protein DIT19_00370, partial [Desulfonauticus sp.]|nr:hypothetical protein [Desulfonauticus sp.]
MSKKRVRELAEDLGVSTKEIIQAAKEIDLHIRSHMTGLTEEQVQKISEIISSQKENKKDVVERKAKDGVIIRRRKKTRSTKETTGTASKELKKEKSEPKPKTPTATIISTPSKEKKDQPTKEETISTSIEKTKEKEQTKKDLDEKKDS